MVAGLIWPGWPRKVWISGCSGAMAPMIASVASALVKEAAWVARQPSKKPASAQAVENWMRVMRARPFFVPVEI